MTSISPPFHLADSDKQAGRRRRLFQRLVRIPSRVAEGLRRVSLERWWLLLFVALFLAFLIALLVQPTIGRGGR